MASLPASTSRRFSPADYKGAPDWFTGRFLSNLNLFTDPVYLALQNGLNFSQNFNAQYFTQQIIAGAAPADNAFSFQNSIQGSPIEVIVASCTVQGNLSIPVFAAIAWYETGGTIFVTGVNGLTQGVVYNLTVRSC